MGNKIAYMYAFGMVVFALACFSVWKTMPPIPAELVSFASVSLGVNIFLAVCLLVVLARSVQHPKPKSRVVPHIKAFYKRLGLPFMVGIVYAVIVTIGFTFCMESFSAGIGGGIVACAMMSFVNRQFPQDTPDNHPHYGPCDANAPGRRCAECKKVRETGVPHA